MAAVSQESARLGGMAAAPATPAIRYAHLAGAAMLAFIALAALWCVGWFVFGYGYWEDDAFIHLEYARSLAEGRGYSFDGLVAYGDTSPIWVMALSAAHAVIPFWMPAGKALMALSCVAALAATYGVASALAPRGVPGSVFAAIMVLLVAVNPYFTHWAVSGMEVQAAIALSLSVIAAAAIGRPRWWTLWAGCALAGLGPLLRPELLLLGVVVAPLFLMRCLALTRGARASVRLAVIAAAAALGSLPTVAWLVYAHTTFGTIVPNTSAAKANFSDTGVVERLAQVFMFGAPLIPLFVLAALVYVVVAAARKATVTAVRDRVREVPAAVWVITAWSVVTCAFYVANNTYVQTRYVLLLVPPVMIVIFRVIPWGAWRGRLWPATAAGVALTSVATSVLVVRPMMADKSELVEQTTALSNFINTEIPANMPIATPFIGQLAFETRHPLVDTLGITRPSVVPLLQTHQDTTEWARREGAVYFVQWNAPEPGAKLLYDVPVAVPTWTFNLGKFHVKNDYLRVWGPPERGADGQK